jgi:DNA-binding NarL/FixJ family response regulator
MANIRIAVLNGGSEPVERALDVLVGAGAEVVATASTVDELLAVTARGRADVVLIDPAVTGAVPGARAAQATAEEPSPLSPRESEVLGMLAAGTHAAAIARQLGISVHTVRGHVKKILSKLGCHSQLEAVAKASLRGWIARPD